MIPVVDLFAGPGGLGEGFANLHETFQIVISAEKDPIAHKTLRLRAFYRYLLNNQPEHLCDYFAYCLGRTPTPVTKDSSHAWEHANNEAQVIELGSKDGNAQLYKILDKYKLNMSRPWVLIGGPPCQAYSLVGRSRNKGNNQYRPEDDPRHFLYKEYLNVIGKYQPAIFVMENVKGILSARVGNEQIFHSILRDLASPSHALELDIANLRYKICALGCDTTFQSGDDPKKINPSDFVVQSELHGIPQARHRVILLGIREDFLADMPTHRLLPIDNQITVEETIGHLPPLRSKLTKEPDSTDNWVEAIHSMATKLANETTRTDIQIALNKINKQNHLPQDIGANCYYTPLKKFDGITGVAELDEWLIDKEIRGYWFNHEARGHMRSDLARYLYASSFAKCKGYSPKGHIDFNLATLKPDHKNWETGNFSDRFRVQLAYRPSTTVTSHISKDGHYYIHYDPNQCRSLTVREAARLQTFPDNYFFEGNRTQQYHQVGNAVPPLLANKIAKIVEKLISVTK